MKTENPCEKHNSNYFHVLLYLAQMLKSLKRLDVTGSKHLKQLPDLSSITSLEELLLEQCTRLEGIPECIGKRSTLKKLKLSYRGGRRSALRFFLRKFLSFVQNLEDMLNTSLLILSNRYPLYRR